MSIGAASAQGIWQPPAPLSNAPAGNGGPSGPPLGLAGDSFALPPRSKEVPILIPPPPSGIKGATDSGVNSQNKGMLAVAAVAIALGAGTFFGVPLILDAMNRRGRANRLHYQEDKRNETEVATQSGKDSVGDAAVELLKNLQRADVEKGLTKDLFDDEYNRIHARNRGLTTAAVEAESPEFRAAVAANGGNLRTAFTGTLAHLEARRRFVVGNVDASLRTEFALEAEQVISPVRRRMVTAHMRAVADALGVHDHHSKISGDIQSFLRTVAHAVEAEDAVPKDVGAKRALSTAEHRQQLRERALAPLLALDKHTQVTQGQALRVVDWMHAVHRSAVTRARSTVLGDLGVLR